MLIPNITFSDLKTSCFCGQNLTILKRAAKLQICPFSKKTFHSFFPSWFWDSGCLYLDSLCKTESSQSVSKPSKLKVKVWQSPKCLKTPSSGTSVYKPYSVFLWRAKNLIHTWLDRPSNKLQKYGELFLKICFSCGERWILLQNSDGWGRGRQDTKSVPSSNLIFPLQNY
jgi:hypothetical protein